MEEVLLLIVNLLVFEVDQLDYVEENEDYKCEGGYIAEVADNEGGQEYFEGPEDGIAHAVVARWQLVVGDLQEVEVLEVVEKLGVLVLVVLLAGVEGDKQGPGQAAKEG